MFAGGTSLETRNRVSPPGQSGKKRDREGGGKMQSRGTINV